MFELVNLSYKTVVVQFDVARTSCACLHGRDARATLKLLQDRISSDRSDSFG